MILHHIFFVQFMAIFLKTNPVYGIRGSVVLRTILVVFLSELSTEYSTLKLPIQVRVGATLRKYDDITLYTGVLFFSPREALKLKVVA